MPSASQRAVAGPDSIGTPMMTFRPASSPYGRPTRVALFSGNYACTEDGANKTLNRVVEHLQTQAGMEVRIYSPTTPVPAFPYVGDLISVPSFRIPTRPDYRIAMGLPVSLQRDVRAFQPDIVHLSAPDLLGSAALGLARKMGVPVVSTLHTHFDTYLDYYGLGWLKPLLQSRLRAFYGSCDYVLAPNPVIAEQLRVEAPSARVRVWARGVDSALFHPGRRSAAWRALQGFPEDRPVVVFLGRAVMEKGLGVFVEAVRRLEQARGPVSVLVIGDGPALPWFKEQLPHAVFTGFITGETLATALASADIFLNPSSTETFGNVNLEAMACGLAMVCADAPNTRARVQNGRSGILCSAQDIGAYCNALETLLDAPSLRAAMGREALNVSASYQWSQILDQIVGVYREAVSMPRPERRSPYGLGQFDPAPRFREPAHAPLTATVAKPND